MALLHTKTCTNIVVSAINSVFFTEKAILKLITTFIRPKIFTSFSSPYVYRRSS